MSRLSRSTAEERINALFADTPKFLKPEVPDLGRSLRDRMHQNAYMGPTPDPIAARLEALESRVDSLASVILRLAEAIDELGGADMSAREPSE